MLLLLLLLPKIPAGMNLYSGAGPVGLKNPSTIGVYPVIWSLSVCRPPQGRESLSYVGGDRRRQEVADVREELMVAHAFTLPRARR